MKKGATFFLQFVVVLIGVGVLAFMLGEPHFEGRNAHATLFEIYFKDPFLAYAYIACIPVFLALYQTFKLLGFARHDRMFSREAVRALWTIKYCAIAVIGFVALGEVFIMHETSDDRAGGVMMGALICFISIVIAAAAATFERILQQAVDMKSRTI